MPTYVYQCRECDHEFEVFAKMSDRPRARKCPVCGGRAQRQISGGAGFLFKGEGFYITDYRSEEYRSKAKAESETPKEAPAAETSQSDARKPVEKEASTGEEAGAPREPLAKTDKKGTRKKGSRRPRGRTR